MTHIYVDNLTIIGSDNGLSPGRRQAIIWTNVGILLIEPLGTNFNEISIGIFIQENALQNGVCEMASILSRPQCVKFVVKGRIDNKTTLIQILALRQTGDKPLTEWVMV